MLSRESFSFFYAAALPFWASRILAFATLSTGLPGLTFGQGILWARGFLSDAGTALLFSLVASLLIRTRRPFFLLIAAVFWSLLAAENFELLKVNFANCDYHFLNYARTMVFLWGSAFSSSAAEHFSFFTAITLLGIFGAEKLLPPRPWPIAHRIAMLLLAGLALSIWPVPFSRASWMGYNVGEENLRIYLHQQHFVKPALSEAVKEKFFTPDLSGVKQFENREQGLPNIIMIAAEGMNLADFQNHRYPRLETRARAGLFFPHFFAIQKQTDRGLYAIHCGDYPNLASKDSKVEILSRRQAKRNCLPEVLQKAGFETFFLQASPLSFMHKDLFATMAGFSGFAGAASFPQARQRNGWGIDDGSFFEAALAKTEELGKAKRPWFLSLLTSGTHHPYNVPVEAQTQEGRATYADAEAFLDQSLDKFLDELARRGTLRKTVVFITGDEATPAKTDPGIEGLLSFNKLFLLTLLPSGQSKEISEVFTQADLELSICDYLSLKNCGTKGRSLFRHYEKSRDLVFSNVYFSRAFLFSDPYGPNSSLVTCDYGLGACDRTKYPGGNDSPSAPDPGSVETLRELASFSDISASP